MLPRTPPLEERYGKRVVCIRNELKGDQSSLKTDNLHITDTAAKKIARKVVTHLKDNLEDTPDDDQAKPQPRDGTLRKTIKNDKMAPGLQIEDDEDEVTEIILTDGPRAARVIGNEGATIRSMKKKHGVNIETKYNGDDRAFHIKGPIANVQSAREEITGIITATLKADQTNKERIQHKEQAICRYYGTKEGCRWGNRRRFQHIKGPVEVSPRS